MTGADQLLVWASELGSGSWLHWRDSARHVGLEPSRAANRFAALGHVEFDWVHDRFAAAPPALVYLPNSGGSLLLTGARTYELTERLLTLAETFAAELIGPVAQTEGPSSYLLRLDLDDAPQLAEALGCELVVDAASSIAERLPPLSFEQLAQRAEPDDRFPRRRLDPVHGFRPAPGRAARGMGRRNAVWWVDEHRRANAWVRDSDAAWWRVPIREYAPFLAHTGATFFQYHPARRRLRVLDHTPLPPLHARAATLCSGRLPIPDPFEEAAGRPAHSYVNVDSRVANLIMTSLNATAGRR